MRYSFLFVFALSFAVLRAEDAAQPAAPAAPAAAPVLEVPPPPPPPLTPEQQKQAFVLYGHLVARQSNFAGLVKQLDMSEAEVDLLLQGIRLAVKGEPLPFDGHTIAAGAEQFFSARANARVQAWTATNAAFLAKIDADTTVTKTASGLRYHINAPGAGDKPTDKSTVTVRYTGRLCDGTIFDTTEKPGGSPVPLSLGGVIRGWTEGLQLIAKGGKIHLWVPADIGYGAQGGGPIPGGSVLDFDIELVDFK